ncbi:hypothetical protein LCGC14_2874970, partial [marine sediment metagenome]
LPSKIKCILCGKKKSIKKRVFKTEIKEFQDYPNLPEICKKTRDILKKREKYIQRLNSLLYRLLAPIKLTLILGATVLILRAIYPGNLLLNSTALTILIIMIIVGILYSFDFLFLIAYAIVRKSSK